MKIFPAIDLRDGKAVRLYQGDYDQMTVYSEDPVDVARSFKEKGAGYLHLVDLDGAKDGQLVNFEGTVAIKKPEFLKEMVKKYGEKIAVGVDARDGYVAINGWKEITDQESFSFCQYLRDIGVKTVIYTDISRDGGLEGTNMDAYRKLQQIEGLEVTASGGISFEKEITELKPIVSAAILGKAIYSGALDLSRAVELAR